MKCVCKTDVQPLYADYHFRIDLNIQHITFYVILPSSYSHIYQIALRLSGKMVQAVVELKLNVAKVWF